ncbi:MAG: hypothetical protein JSR17_04655 [Proteobacteria bacterium]|nr:hypothetical protein [Pseudomonadota bacterium]
MKLAKHELDKRHIFSNFLSYFSLTCHAQKHRGCSYTLPEADFPVFNSVLDTVVKDQNPIALIDEIKKIYSHKKQFCWWITDFVQPQTFEVELQNNGFQKGSKFTGMVYDLSAPLKFSEEVNAIQVKHITQQDQIDEWIKILQVCFGIDDASTLFCATVLKQLFDDPRVKHYYVAHQDKMVGIGTLFIENGISGFYNLGVLPEFRYQKIATALKCYRLKQSQEMGVKVAILQSSEMGTSLDLQLGFKPVFDFVPYFSPVLR